jgi:predicted nucleic acid-binding protein
MPICDTSWLIALVHGDDAHHATARSQAGTADRYLVPGVVVAEFVAALVARIRKVAPELDAPKEAKARLQEILSNPAVDVEPSYPVRKVHATYFGEPALSYPDAVGVVTALVLGQDLLTFDKTQASVLKKMRKAATRD